MDAHEEALRRALLPLAAAFEQWRAGELRSRELSERIHRFHDGPARELFNTYHGTREFAVAHAIVSGVLDRSHLPAELLEALRPYVALCEEHRS